MSRDLPISCTSASYQSHFVAEAPLRSSATRFRRHCFFLVFDIVSRRARNGSRCVGVDGVQLQRSTNSTSADETTYLNYLPSIEVVGPLSQNINDTLYFHSRCPVCDTWFRPTKGSWLDENSLWSIKLQLYSLSRFVRPRFILGDRKSVEASPFESSFVTRKRLKYDIAEFAGCSLLKLPDVHFHVNCHERAIVSSILIRSDCTVCVIDRRQPVRIRFIRAKSTESHPSEKSSIERSRSERRVSSQI